MKSMQTPLRVVAVAALAALGMMCSRSHSPSPTGPSSISSAVSSETSALVTTEAAPASPAITAMKFSLGSCRTSTSTTWNGCDGTATVTISKAVTSGYVALTLNYGCGTAYTCASNWHGEVRVTSTTPGSISIPITSTALPRSLCVSPMSTVVNVFDTRDGRGDKSNELYSQGSVLTLNCGTTTSTPPSATSAQFNGTWRGTFTGQASGVLEFSISGSTITLEEPEEGTGTLSLSSVYGISSFFTRSETRSCTWTGPFLPGGARQSSASGLWSCSDSTSGASSGEWSAARTSATAAPAPTPAPTPTTPTPSTGGSFTVLSATAIRCTEAGAGYNCRTGTFEIRNDSSSLTGKVVRLQTDPSHILTPTFTMPAVNGTARLTVNSSPSTFSCPPTQTRLWILQADSTPGTGTFLASQSISVPVSCSP